MRWRHPNPFILQHTVLEEEIDHLNHVNNKVYLEWMEHIAWQHSLSVGIDAEKIKSLGKVMVIARHEMNFHAGCFLDETLHIGTWVTRPLSSKKRERFYQVIREEDGKTVFTAKTLWVCVNLSDHKSTAIPQALITPYQTQNDKRSSRIEPKTNTKF